MCIRDSLGPLRGPWGGSKKAPSGLHEGRRGPHEAPKRAPISVTRERLRVTALGGILRPSWGPLGPFRGSWEGYDWGISGQA
eukprot:9481065-Pyramimonas_sp.AAC.1